MAQQAWINNVMLQWYNKRTPKKGEASYFYSQMTYKVKNKTTHGCVQFKI